MIKCHGDHFDAWSLPSRLRFFYCMGIRSRSFQRLTSHLIAFHHPRHGNFIQFGCCWCLENLWIRFRPMRTKPPGHCPQTFIEVHWRLCQYLCNKLRRKWSFAVCCELSFAAAGVSPVRPWSRRDCLVRGTLASEGKFCTLKSYSDFLPYNISMWLHLSEALFIATISQCLNDNISSLLGSDDIHLFSL